MPGQLIAIVDDDAAVRLSTAQLLEDNGFEVRLFENGDDFLASPHADRFSCILLDLQMPGSDGLAVLAALAEQKDVPPVLVLTGHGDIAAAVEAMKRGAHDFLEKAYDPAALLDAIETMRASRLKTKEARMFGREAVARVAALSTRERQLLRGILNGHQNKIMAYEMGLSIRTVESYHAQVLKKLGARGTAEAIRVALAAGMVND